MRLLFFIPAYCLPACLRRSAQRRFIAFGDPLATFGAQFAPGFFGGCRCNILTTLRTRPLPCSSPAGLSALLQAEARAC